MNMTSPSEMLVFGCSLHKHNCYILSEFLVSQIFQSYSSINEGGVLRYIDKARSRYGIGTPTTCGYHDCGESTGFNVRSMFAQSYFSLTVNQNTLNNFFLI